MSFCDLDIFWNLFLNGTRHQAETKLEELHTFCDKLNVLEKIKYT